MALLVLVQRVFTEMARGGGGRHQQLFLKQGADRGRKWKTRVCVFACVCACVFMCVCMCVCVVVFYNFVRFRVTLLNAGVSIVP